MANVCPVCQAPVSSAGELCPPCKLLQRPLRTAEPRSPIPEAPAPPAAPYYAQPGAAPPPTAPAPPPVEGLPDDEPAFPPHCCQNCGAEPIEAGYEFALCAPCRAAMIHRPVPVGIRVAAALVALCLVVAFAQFPRSLGAGIAEERGQRDEAAHKYAAAEREYKTILKQYPHSTEALARYGLAAYHAKDYETAADAFDQISGKQDVDDDVIDQVNAAIGDMEKQFGDEDEPQPKAPAHPHPAGRKK